MRSMDFSPQSGDGFEWLDIEELGSEAEEVLAGRFGFDQLTIDDLKERSLIPRVRPLDDRLQLVLHSLDAEGHLLELDLVIGDASLITVHKRMNETVALDVAMRETTRVQTEISNGSFDPSTPSELAAAIIMAIGENLEVNLAQAAEKAGVLDRRMREGNTGDPEMFLDELFDVRRDLVTVANRAKQSRDALSTALGVARNLDAAGIAPLMQTRDRFERLSHVCEGERGFLQEVLDYHEHRTNTKMNFAMERLALIAAVVLPINALAGIIGMNTIATEETNLLHTASLVVAMGSLAGIILLWAKRKGWW